MEFTILGKLPTLNQYISAERRNRYLAAKIKKDATQDVAWQVKGIPPIKNPANYTFVWYVKNSRIDSDNIAFACKFIFDGMQQAGVLANDGFNDVLSISHKFETSKDERVQVIVDELAHE